MRSSPMSCMYACFAGLRVRNNVVQSFSQTGAAAAEQDWSLFGRCKAKAAPWHLSNIPVPDRNSLLIRFLVGAPVRYRPV